MQCSSHKLHSIFEIREKQVAVTQKELEATITKRAEAEKSAKMVNDDAALYQTQKDAEARKIAQMVETDANLYKTQKDVEAALYQLQKNAEANLEAAQAEAKSVAAKGQAEAIAIKATGEAEATAIKAKGLSEAEALDKKADAMAKYGDAAKQDMQLEAIKTYFNALPEIAGNVAKPMANIDSINMYGEGNTAKLTGDITKTISQFTNGLTDSLGIDPKMLLSSLMGSKLAGVGTKADK